MQPPYYIAACKQYVVLCRRLSGYIVLYSVIISLMVNIALLRLCRPVSRRVSQHLTVLLQHTSQHLTVLLQHTSQHLSVSSQHLTVSSQHLTVSSQHLTVSSQHLTVSSQHLKVSSQHLTVSSQHLTASLKHHLTTSSQHSQCFTDGLNHGFNAALLGVHSQHSRSMIAVGPALDARTVDKDIDTAYHDIQSPRNMPAFVHVRWRAWD